MNDEIMFIQSRFQTFDYLIFFRFWNNKYFVIFQTPHIEYRNLCKAKTELTKIKFNRKLPVFTQKNRVNTNIRIDNFQSKHFLLHTKSKKKTAI